VGIRFEEPVDVTAILSGFGEPADGGKVSRAPRLTLSGHATIAARDRLETVELQDISQRGVKVRTSLLSAGDEVTILLDGLDARKAVVRWTRLGSAGLNFLRPLGFDELGEWVISRQLAVREFSQGGEAGL
jgi:hypothetical protein